MPSVNLDAEHQAYLDELAEYESDLDGDWTALFKHDPTLLERIATAIPYIAAANMLAPVAKRARWTTPTVAYESSLADRVTCTNRDTGDVFNLFAPDDPDEDPAPDQRWWWAVSGPNVKTGDDYGPDSRFAPTVRQAFRDARRYLYGD